MKRVNMQNWFFIMFLTHLACVHFSVVALNYTIAKGTIPLGGARNPDQARQNVKAFGWRLSDKEVEELDDVALVGDKGVFWQHG